MRPWFWRHQEPQGAWKREVAGAGGCSAAWAIQVARLAVAGAGVCRRCDAVGAVKTTEVTGVQHGRQKSRDWPWQGQAFAAAATQWGR